MSFVVGAFALFGLSGTARAESSCGKLRHVHLQNAEVTAVTEEAAGALTTCRVQVFSRPTARSDIRIEVWIPMGERWNGKYLQLGNGGPAGIILTDALRSMAAQGYVVANSDMGHTLANTDWMKDRVKWDDLSWRALKETTRAAKTLIVAAKGAKARKSYFAGCSEGGREALMEAQRFPEDFDGIIAGAPANYYGRLISLYGLTQRALLQPGGHLAPSDLRLIESAVLDACGGGAWVRDPKTCRFNPDSLACTGTKALTCLTAQQVATLRTLYRGFKFDKPEFDYPGFTPGAEATSGNWGYFVAPTPETQRTTFAYLSVGIAMSNLAFGGAPIDPAELTDAQLMNATSKMAAIMDASSPDLRRFRAHGGKLIQFHGWSDSAIPAAGSILYYEDVAREMGDVDDFYRLYMVPGMFHCGLGPAPHDVDWVGLLDDWASRGRAPGNVSPDFVRGSFIEFPIKGAPILPWSAR